MECMEWKDKEWRGNFITKDYKKDYKTLRSNYVMIMSASDDLAETVRMR